MNYALAFGLINPNIKNTNQVILYKLEEESIKSEYQIGNKFPPNAYDILYTVTEFEYRMYEVKNYEFDSDYYWLHKTLKWEIDFPKYKLLVDKIHYYLEEM